MFILFDQAQTVDLYVDASEEDCIRLAAADLAGDLVKAGAVHPAKLMLGLPGDNIDVCYEAGPTGLGGEGETTAGAADNSSDGRGSKAEDCSIGRRGITARLADNNPDGRRSIIAGSVGNGRFCAFARKHGVDASKLQGKWERYEIVPCGSDGQTLLILGSDPRGVMWGIYELSGKALGIDPLYLWTGSIPEQKITATVAQLPWQGGPETYRFRGWFINDEDLLTQWKDGGGFRTMDYPYYHQVVHEDVMEMVIETALRLKQNLLIPASFVDIDNPAEERLVRQVVRRGLYITQHHVEPLGVSHFAWEKYWKDRGSCPGHPSYIQHPELLEEIWTHYAKRWAIYPNVIWQLGLRGRGDAPVWEHDPDFPREPEERGRIISQAISRQLELVRSIVGDRPIYSTSTLWMEASMLHHQGFLAFPEDTMVIFADFGPTQTWGRDFYSVARQPGTAYGGYYHLGFWSDGPHLVQGNPLANITANYEEAIRKGDTAYSIINVGNIRELVLGIQAAAAIEWDGEHFSEELFMEEWVRRQFQPEPQQVEAGVKVLQSFYEAYHIGVMEMRFLEGMAKRVGMLAISLLKGEPFRPVTGVQNRKLTDFASGEAFAAYYLERTELGWQKWQEVLNESQRYLPHVHPARSRFYRDSVLVQAELMYGLCSWAHGLLQAVCLQDRLCVESAASALRHALKRRQEAEWGPWENWYKGDAKLDMPGLLRATEELLKRQAQ
ncbi:MAG: hypothetical protein K0R57_740 [Paenibacillaceae bacterium]|nr:hypothetical protein [Paenibacillaceae bacterium]